MEIFGTNLGITLSNKTLRAQVEQLGWTVQKIKFDSKIDRYTAEAKDETGLKLSRNGKTEELALSNLILAITKRHIAPRLSRWNTTFTNQLADIAEAYSKAPLYEPKASAAFMELAKDSERRALVLAEHLQIQVVNDPEPYKNPQKLADDVKKKRNLFVSRVGADHPLWSEKQVIAYRICHDVLGYVAADAGWDWAGENLAFAHHAALLSVEAQKALFSESVAQAAYATHYRAYGQQKIALFPQFMDKAQKVENPHDKHPGVHPSQSFPAVPLPHAKHIVESSEEEDTTEPHTSLYAFGAFDQKVAVLGGGTVNPNLQDPNANYTSPYEQNPIMTPNGQTLAQAYGDPMQVAETQANANLINTSNAPSTNGVEWAYLNQNDPGQVALMKRAIVNAFRVVLLSPRKDLRWNAVHYQHISHIPAEVDDPTVYWDTLEKARQDWNVARGFGQYDHVPYMKLIPALVNVLYQKNYMGGYDAALKRSKELIHDWLTEEQNRQMRLDEEKPEAKRRLGFQIETKANYELAKRLKMYLAESKPGLDHLITKQVKRQLKEEPIDTEQYRAAAVWSPGDWGADDQPIDKGKYGAFMGNHLKSLAAISQHADNLLKAALEDVHEHDGTGHHFRAVVLQLGVPGVGPKVCSFAWLLLQPMTSELGTIDTHMMDLLGHQEKEMNNRDYFGMERELKAGRDAAGYSHVPLGQFQWGMWDYKRTGAGVHQDHSAMAVLDPKSHDSIDWAAKEQPINAQQAMDWKNMWQTQPPEWWAATQPARQEAWDDFRANQANKVAQGKVPWTNVPADYDPSVLSPSSGLGTTSRVAMHWDDEGNVLPIPPMTPDERLAYVVHPQTGSHIIGRLGQSAMSHVMETMHHQDPREVWAQDYEVGKELPMPPSIPTIPEAPTPFGAGAPLGARHRNLCDVG